VLTQSYVDLFVFPDDHKLSLNELARLAYEFDVAKGRYPEHQYEGYAFLRWLARKAEGRQLPEAPPSWWTRDVT
jgi:hypothetical protein